jgi:hypothetical protein
MTAPQHEPRPGFARWEADDALDALHGAGLDIHHVEQARWPASAPQPKTHRQAFTFRSSEAIDPHLLLVFDSPEALEVWRLWLARYWKARPYLSIHDNVILLVSRDLSVGAAAQFHEAMSRLGHLAAAGTLFSAAAPSAVPTPGPVAPEPESQDI